MAKESYAVVESMTFKEIVMYNEVLNVKDELMSLIQDNIQQTLQRGKE